jgi:hypothetical protein
MPDADALRFTVATGPPSRPAPDVRILAACIPGAGVRDGGDPARVTGELRLSGAGGGFSGAGTATLHDRGDDGWTLRLEAAQDGGGGPVAEVTVGGRGPGSAGRAVVTITPAGRPGHDGRRVAEIVGRRVAEQFFRNLAAVPTSPALPAPSDSAAPRGRRLTAARVAVLLMAVVVGVAASVRAVRKARHG